MPTRYNLNTNAPDAIDRAFDAFFAERARKDERDFREKQRQAGLIEKGLIETDTGFEEAPWRSQKREADLLSKGIEVGEGGLLGFTPEEQQRRALERRGQESQIRYRDALAQKSRGKSGTSGGKELKATEISRFQEGNAIPQMLGSIQNLIDEKSEMFGPVIGRLGSMNPYAKEAQSADAELRAVSQMFGRYMEGGVLRKEDEEKYRRMFPQLSDTPDVAKEKLSIVDRLLKQRQQSLIDALSEAGYDTQSLRMNPESMGPTEGLLQDGLLESAPIQETKPEDIPLDQRIDAMKWVYENPMNPDAPRVMRMIGVDPDAFYGDGERPDEQF